MMDILKGVVFKIIPDKYLKLLKKYHFYYKVKNFKAIYEEDLLIIEKLITPNTDTIDIGANIGLYTKFMSKHIGNFGRVFSIEPIPETLGYLKNNIEKLHLKNVIALNIAISDKKGHAIMQIPRFKDNRLNFYEAAITNKPDSSYIHFEVETKTLDEICIQYNIKPSFIKCDVEGHEWYVFGGAGKILAQYKPILLIEINHDLINPDLNTENLLNYLNSKGYDTFVNVNNRLKKHRMERKYNYYFLTKEHIHNLKEVIDITDENYC